MADFKGCDIHDKEFPANLVPASTIYKVYVQKEEIDIKTKKKITTALFMGEGESASEGVDGCHKCTMAAIMDRLVGAKTKFTWRRFHWETIKKKKKDGSEYDSLDRVFEEIPIGETPLSK